MSSQATERKPIGARLTALMLERDLRAEDVASRLVVSHRTIVRWMNGSNEPSPTMARRLGEFFEVDWRSFYEEAA
jgi:transcriptional regulator with XRE-family HTH domain